MYYKSTVIEPMKQKQTKPKKRLRNWLVLSGAVLGLGMGISKWYVQDQIDSRLQAYDRELKIHDLGVDPEFRSLPPDQKQFPYRIKDFSFVEKALYLWAIESKEENFTENLDQFLSFAHQHLEDLITLTNTDNEKGGTLKRGYTGMELIPRQDLYGLAEKYLTEFLDGNYQNGNLLIEELQRPELGGGDPDKLAQALNILYLQDLLQKKDLTPELEDLLSKANLTFAEVESTAPIIRKTFVQNRDDWRRTFQYQANPEAELKDRNILARYHTHPKDHPEGIKPSHSDQANSLVIGPSLVFAQDDETLHLYLVLRGESREIYTARIADPEMQRK